MKLRGNGNRIIQLVVGNLIVSLIVLTSTIVVMPAWAANKIPVNCQRECLISVMNQYLQALVSRDRSELPLAKEVKFTENGQIMDVGDAHWNTVTALGRYQHYIADPQGQAVGFVGSISESGNPHILATRIKIENREITEIETLIYRNKSGVGGGDKLDAMSRKAIWDESLAPSERVSREKMIAAANDYFEKIEGGNGKHPTKFDPSCNRVENAMQTTNVPDTESYLALGCDAQLSSGRFTFDTELRDRRFTVVDEEKGVVFGHVFFDHAGDVLTWTDLATGEVHQNGKGVLFPSAWMITEIFKIKNGRIYEIEAVLLDVPYKMKSGWELE